MGFLKIICKNLQNISMIIGLYTKNPCKKLSDGTELDKLFSSLFKDFWYIHRATLDVCQNEPLPPQHPFWQEPRITLTPHIAALTVIADSAQQIAQQISQIEQNILPRMGRIRPLA